MASASYSVWSSAVLLLILALIPVSLWCAKRFTLLPVGRPGRLRVIESLSVGPRERLLLVDTGEEHLLIGSSSNGLTVLRTMSDPIPTDGTDAKSRASAFSNVLLKMTNRG